MNPILNCIVVIDDDDATNFLTGIILKKAGCARHIKFFQRGREALEYLDKCAMMEDIELYPVPDLIFLDINMPAMNGWEFLEIYKNLEIRNKIIVVMLTTSLFPDDRLKAEKHENISAFEVKPISIPKINAVVEKFFIHALN